MRGFFTLEASDGVLVGLLGDAVDVLATGAVVAGGLPLPRLGVSAAAAAATVVVDVLAAGVAGFVLAVALGVTAATDFFAATEAALGEAGAGFLVSLPAAGAGGFLATAALPADELFFADSLQSNNWSFFSVGYS